MLALLAISFGASPTLFGATTIALSAITWYAAYETKYAQWTKGLEPNWRQENSKILSNWYNDYTSWLKDQGFSKHIQNATLYAVCSYSTENSKSMGQRNCESISVTDLGVKSSTSTFEELERRNPDEYLLSIQTHLEDALEQLTDEEYTIYAEFNSIGEQKKTSLMSGLPSTKRYLKELRESLFSRTMFLSDLETRSRWEQLLAIPDFLERQIITNSTTDQQMALHSFIENIIDSEEPTCHLIKANSGHGKTTLMTQLVIHLIETNSDTDVHPLLIKARNNKSETFNQRNHYCC